MDNDAKVNLMNEDLHEWADDHKGQEFFGIKWEHSRDRRLIVAYRVKEELENLERHFSEEQNPSAAHSVRLCIEAIDGIEGYGPVRWAEYIDYLHEWADDHVEGYRVSRGNTNTYSPSSKTRPSFTRPVRWAEYIQYLHEWADDHKGEEFFGMTPVRYYDWTNLNVQ